MQKQTLLLKQKAELASVNNQITSQERIIGTKGLTAIEVEKEALKLTELRQQRDALGIRHLAEQEEAYRKSADGLREYIKALSDGDKQADAFARNGAIKSILEDQASLLEQNIYLQEKIKSSRARFGGSV